MKKIIAVLVLSLSVTACASPAVYGKPNNTLEQERKDFAMCKYEALKATGSSTSGSFSTDTSATIANDIATGARQGEIMRACLEANGYRQQ